MAVLVWALSHAFAILAHIGMALACLISFIFAHADLSDGEAGFELVSVVPWAGFGVVSRPYFLKILAAREGELITLLQAGFAIMFNAALLIFVILLERRTQSDSLAQRYFKKRVAFIIGCVFNLLFIAGDSAIAAKLFEASSQVKVTSDTGSNDLTGAGVMAVISA